MSEVVSYRSLRHDASGGLSGRELCALLNGFDVRGRKHRTLDIR